MAGGQGGGGDRAADRRRCRSGDDRAASGGAGACPCLDSAVRARCRYTLRRGQRAHQVTQHRGQPRRRAGTTAAHDDLDLDRCGLAACRGGRRGGQVVDGDPDRHGSRCRLRRGSRRRRTTGTDRCVSWTLDGAGDRLRWGAGAHRCSGSRLRRGGRSQRSQSAYQRKRRDQGACEDVHAPTLDGERPRRATRSPIGDNFTGCGYRALHRGGRRAMRGGDFCPGHGPRRLINAVCAQQHVHGTDRLRAPPVLVHPVVARNADVREG
ncbi:hypothetical protein DFR69_101674 [Nocardia neocaledoniensis]|uniref:Uncharacterized protein n=1 Tax=Nocardia neocaledoniensis TaxID=236511 RepID=A0A317P4M6_9NOCA|nr:hypothetical protein DFR69_101674 [Nocardia neocaledoniensis]